MVKTTRAQRETLLRKWKEVRRSEDNHDALTLGAVLEQCANPTYKSFRKKVQPTFGMDGAIVVPWCGMLLCIETDGYCHT